MIRIDKIFYISVYTHIIDVWCGSSVIVIKNQLLFDFNLLTLLTNVSNDCID